jgi:hypothetical protein
VIRQHRTLAQGCAVLIAAAFLATGCSSSKSSTTGAGTSGGATTTTSSAAPTTSAAAGAQPTDVAAATAAVTKLYTDYYDNTLPISGKANLVQNADKMSAILTALQAAAGSGKSSATVTGVTFSSATHANVVFDIYLNGSKVVSGITGQALYDQASGNWQVADVTLCSLAKLSGVAQATLTAAGCP